MRNRTVLETLIVMAAAAAVLYVLSGSTDRTRWYPSMLSDELGYVSVAKNLLNHGEMRSAIIYTSTLKQKTTRNCPYMPGHYLTVALAFVVGGAGRTQAIWPSLISYCLAAGCTYLTGRKLYGRSAGALAAAVFAILPACLAYAFTAMSELTFIAAVSMAFCVFVHLPPRLKVWCGPVLLAIPFLFRETGALLVIPMGGLILGGIPLLQRISRSRWRDACVLYIVGVALLVGLYKSPVCGRRPTLMKMMIFDVPSLDIYSSATAEDGIPKGFVPWVKAIGGNIGRNLKALRMLDAAGPAGMESGCMATIAAGIVLSLWIGWRRRDAAAFAFGCMGLAALGLITSLYGVSGYREMRNLLFLWPMLALPIGAWLDGIVSSAMRRPVLVVPLVVVETAAVAVSLSLATRTLEFFTCNDAFDVERSKLIESIKPDPGRLLASPATLGLAYVANHDDAWAFLPRDEATLAVLMRRYDVGTLILAEGQTTLEYRQLRRMGFVLDRELEFEKLKLEIYRRPAKAFKKSWRRDQAKPSAIPPRLTRPTT